MSVTDIPAPLVHEGSGEDRAAYIQGLIDEALFYETHPDVPLPGIDGHVTESIAIPQQARGLRLEVLHEIASRMGADVVHRDGCLVAERPFGPRTLRASVTAGDFTEAFLRGADRKRQAAAEAAASAPEATADGESAGELVECVTCGRKFPAEQMDMNGMISYPTPGSLRGTPRPTCRTDDCIKWAFANGRVA